MFKQSAIRAPEPIDVLGLLALSAMWSSSFLFTKLALESFPPLTLAAGRITLGALVLLLYLRLRAIALPRDWRSWRLFLIVGATGNSIPFFLIGWGQTHIDASLAAILIGTAPLWGFVLAHFFTNDEKLTISRFAGVLLGLLGVVVLIGADALAGLGSNVFAQLAVMGAALCYVIANLLARRLGPQTEGVTATAVLLTAAVVMVPLSLVLDSPFSLAPSGKSLSALLVLGVFPTALAMVVLFRLVQRTGATFPGLNNYLNPPLGLLWGTLFLGETPPGRAFAGLLLILAGLLVSQYRRRNPVEGPPTGR